jgi:hypothetical protein
MEIANLAVMSIQNQPNFQGSEKDPLVHGLAPKKRKTDGQQ